MTNKEAILSKLKEEIAIRTWRNSLTQSVISTGIADIDQALGTGGISHGSVHEIFSEHGPSALGFGALLLKALAKHGSILWSSAEDDLYMPGLFSFGLGEEDIIFARSKNHQESFWAMEQGLMCKDFAAVAMATERLSSLEARRIKLLAEKHQSIAFVLIKNSRHFLSSAHSRWWVGHEVSLGHNARHKIKAVGSPRFLLKLLRNFGGQAPLSWIADYHEKYLYLHRLPAFSSSASPLEEEGKTARYC
jgi:hypothetical protein